MRQTMRDGYAAAAAAAAAEEQRRQTDEEPVAAAPPRVTVVEPTRRATSAAAPRAAAGTFTVQSDASAAAGVTQATAKRRAKSVDVGGISPNAAIDADEDDPANSGVQRGGAGGGFNSYLSGSLDSQRFHSSTFSDAMYSAAGMHGGPSAMHLNPEDEFVLQRAEAGVPSVWRRRGDDIGAAAGGRSATTTEARLGTPQVPGSAAARAFIASALGAGTALPNLSLQTSQATSTRQSSAAPTPAVGFPPTAPAAAAVRKDTSPEGRAASDADPASGTR